MAMIRSLLAALFILAVAAVLAVVAWPQLFGLHREPLIAQAVALRGLTAVIAGVALLGFVILALLSPIARRLAATITAVLLVFALVNVAVLTSRGTTSSDFGPAESDVTVLTWNTLGDAPGAETIAELAIDTGADVVSLPETTAETGAAVAELMAAAGMPMQAHTAAFDEVSKARSTTLLVSTALGEYVLDEQLGTTSVLPSVVAAPAAGDGPTIVAVHAVSPVPAQMDRWRSDLDWLADVCRGANVIVAGDVNATLDHLYGLGDGDAPLGRCRDAGEQSGAAAIGTWPTALPPLLGAPIDHVFFTEGWRVAGMRVLETHDGHGSDHRPLVVTLQPRG